jgi:aspartate carbamoyltransferase catalytic subunit
MSDLTTRPADRMARLIPSVLAEETAASAIPETSQGALNGCVSSICDSLNTHPHHATELRHVLGIDDVSRIELDRLFQLTDDIKSADRHELRTVMRGQQLVTAFFEPSTRTRLSFQCAMLRLGGSSHGFTDLQQSRMAGISAESIADTARMLGLYGDVIVARHPLRGAVDVIARHAGVPTINAGDGTGEHPTQTMVDLYTLRELLGDLDGVRILVLNDLRMRCVRSLVKAVQIFNGEIHIAGSQAAEGQRGTAGSAEWQGIRTVRYERIEDAIRKVDAVYVSPTVHRVSGNNVDADLTARVLMTSASTGRQKSGPFILHPLPRGPELPVDLDHQPQSVYFQQAANAVPLRMALLMTVLPN